MKRTDHIFNKGDMYRLIPSFVKTVFPGEKLEVSVRGSLESDIVAALRAPAVMASYAFYVPFRLLWASWPEFISDADTALTVPSVNISTSPFPEVGETGNFLSAPFFRRALKLAYNEYFGDESFGAHAWYTDVAADTAQNVMLPLKTVNQILSALALDTDEPSDNYSVVANTIELTEFRRRLKANARGNNQRIGGEKYVDALRRFGVDMREELAARPEMIGRQSEVIYPQEVFNTSETNTGSRVGRYRAALDFRVKRRFCMEHGVVFVVHSLRPFLARTRVTMDRSMMARHWFMEEPDKQFREVQSTWLGTATDVEPDPLVPAARWTNLGDMVAWNGVDGTFSYASDAALANLIYPTVSGSPKVVVSTSCEANSLR